MSLFIDIRLNEERIADLKISRVDGDTHPDSINLYRWYYTRDGLHEASGMIEHRYGDGAMALACKVLGNIDQIDRAEPIARANSIEVRGDLQ